MVEMTLNLTGGSLYSRSLTEGKDTFCSFRKVIEFPNLIVYSLWRTLNVSEAKKESFLYAYSHIGEQDKDISIILTP